MIWFKSLFNRCQHKWEVYEKVEVYDTYIYIVSNAPIRHDYVLRCKHCGDMKKVKG